MVYIYIYIYIKLLVFYIELTHLTQKLKKLTLDGHVAQN